MKIAFIAVLLAAAVAPAQAIDFYEGQFTNEFNASAACFPALPVYDGNVRKRPLAVVNEGVRDSYVTCSYITATEAWKPYGGIERADIRVNNQNTSGGNKTVTCLGVFGIEGGTAVYLAKTVSLAPGQGATITWDHTQYPQFNNQGLPGPVNMSCLLPPGTALNRGSVHWDYQDAATP